MLADKANITLQSQGPRPEAGSPQDKNTLFAAMAWAQKLYADCLLKADSGAPGREYVARAQSDAGKRVAIWPWLRS